MDNLNLYFDSSVLNSGTHSSSFIFTVSSTSMILNNINCYLYSNYYTSTYHGSIFYDIYGSSVTITTMTIT